jgi:hypothetical protein
MMGKRLSILAIAVVASLMALGTSLAPADVAPRWVQHVRNYPGGISGGVRASLDAATSRANPGRARTRSARSSSSGRGNSHGLRNRKVNSHDSNPPLPQNETQVVHSEFNDLVAVAGANDYVKGGSQLYRTNDGGRHWSSQFSVPRVTETGDPCFGGDPALTYSKRDRAFYFAQLCFTDTDATSEIEVVRSLDNGRTWTRPRTGAYPVSNFDPGLDDFDPALFYDKEQITVDNSRLSPHYGRIYVTYIKFHIEPDGFSDYCTVQVAYTDSIDPNGDGDLRDAVWSRTAIVPDNPGDDGIGGSANQGAQPVVDAQGGLNVSYLSEDCNTSIDRAIFLKRSTNGGASFGARHTINKSGQWAGNPDPAGLLPDKNAPLAVSTSAPLVFNPVDGSLNYIVQNNINRAVSGADISFTKSFDHGTTWSAMATVSVDGSGNPARNDQFFPWMDVDPEGNLHAIWFDNRDNPANRLIRTYQGYSADGGTTWSNVNISTEPWNPNRSFFDTGDFIGDYNGLAVGDGVIYPIWTDGRDTPGSPDGDTDIWTNVELNTFPLP